MLLSLELGVRGNMYFIISGIYLSIYLKPFRSPQDPVAFEARVEKKR